MRIAEIAVPVSVACDTTFDYIIPRDAPGDLAVGARVLVPLRQRRVVGYLTGFKSRSRFQKQLRPILRVLDAEPVLTPDLFGLSRKIRDMYLVSLAEAFECVLPSGARTLRKPFPPPLTATGVPTAGRAMTPAETAALREMPRTERVLIHDEAGHKRWTYYAAAIKETLNNGQAVIVLIPDHKKIRPFLEQIGWGDDAIELGSHRTASQNLSAWSTARVPGPVLVIGPRSAVFAPVANLGLILIDEEEHFAYHQEQMPHIRAHVIANFRQEISKNRIILGSRTPTLEAVHAVQAAGQGLLHLKPSVGRAKVAILDTTREEGNRFRRTGVSSGLEHRIRQSLQDKETLLIFGSQKGSSGTLYCRKCRASVRCPRCSVPLKLHASARKVVCPVCGHEEPSFDLCPVCKSSYVRPLGFGIEKVAQELSRIFPAARIAQSPGPHDIMVATASWLEDPALESLTFDKVISIDPDILWSRPDFRSEERAFRRLDALVRRARRELCVQTRLADHELYRDIEQEHSTFYERALRERQETHWPPFSNVALIQIRASKDKKAQEAALKVHARIKKDLGTAEGVEVFEPAPASPHQVRGKFRYQILIRSRDIRPVLEPARKILKDAPSGVIVTFDPEME